MTDHNDHTVAGAPDAAYHQAAQREQHRTIRIQTPIDAKLYGELLVLITDRWPKAKLAHGGIHIPDDTDD